MKNILNKKVIWTTLIIIFVFPFLGLIFNEWFGWNLGNIITITTESKVFLSVWTTAFGVIGLIINIVINSGRLTNQEKQLQLQLKNERNSRFSKAIELLGNNHESARIGAVHTLISLAKEYENDYKELVFNILCSHIRTTTSKSEYKVLYDSKPSNEILTIIEILFKKGTDNRTLFEGFKADLSGSFLKGLNLNNSAFNNTNFTDVNLIDSNLNNIDFIGSTFSNADLRTKMITHCNFSSSTIINSHLENTMLDVCHFEDSFISNCHFELCEMFSPYFIGASIIKSHFEGTYINDGHFEGSNISTTLYIRSYISNSSFNGSLIYPTVRFNGATIEDVSFDGAFLKMVCFKGCAIDNASILGGGNFELTSQEINKFYGDRTLLLEKQVNKDSILLKQILFGSVDFKLMQSIDRKMKDGNVEENIINRIYEELSSIQHIESSKDNFNCGLLPKVVADKSISIIKESEINCGGWRQNRNRSLI